MTSIRASRFWVALNSPVGVALLSGIILAGAGKLYADHQADQQDRNARRELLGKLITEFSHRYFAISQADAELSPLMGPGPSPPKSFRLSAAKKPEFDKLAQEVSAKEWDAINGDGSYTPTSPEYRNVNIQTIVAEEDSAVGVPDAGLGGLRTIGLLDTPPPATWVFMRALAPFLLKNKVGMDILYDGGELPLMRGQHLSARQATMLGFAHLNPEEAAVIRQKNDRLMAQINAEKVHLDQGGR